MLPDMIVHKYDMSVGDGEGVRTKMHLTKEGW